MWPNPSGMRPVPAAMASASIQPSLYPGSYQNLRPLPMQHPPHPPRPSHHDHAGGSSQHQQQHQHQQHQQQQHQQASNGDRSNNRGACVACRDAHTACDMGRPCARCRRLGKPHLCHDAPTRKRGRPIQKAENESELNSTSTTDERENASIKQDDPVSFGGQEYNEQTQQADKKSDSKRQKLRAVATANIKQAKHKRMQALEEKVEVLSGLVDRLSADVEQLRQSNSDLTRLVAKLRGQHRLYPIGNGENEARSSDHSSSPSMDPAVETASAIYTPTTPTLSFPSRPQESNKTRPSQGGEINTQNAGVSPALVLEARKKLPWLQYYEIPPRFAIRSFSLPICVLEERYSWEVPTIVIYANAAFAELSQYSLEELVGAMYTKLFSLPPNVHLYTTVLYNQRPMVASELISFGLTLRRKDGALLRLNDQSQLFYDAQGQARYVMMCIHGWHMDRLCPGECLDYWMPLRNPFGSKSLDQPSSYSAMPASSPVRHASGSVQSPHASLNHSTLLGNSSTLMAPSIDTLEFLDQLPEWNGAPSSSGTAPNINSLGLGALGSSQQSSTTTVPSVHSSTSTNLGHLSFIDERSFM